MVQIKIKAINKSYRITCEFDDFSLFLNQLEERLKACSNSNGGHFEAFFHVKQKLSAEQLLDVLQVAQRSNTLILGINESKDQKDLMILHENLYNGQTYHFEKEVLLLGSIGMEAFVTSSENIYCIGQVSGNIDLLHEDCRIYASNFFQANIRICDSAYQNVTNYSSSYVYYNDANVIVSTSKEEKVWGVQ